MKKLKLFPRTFIYVTGLMLVIALLAHALIYLFLPIFYTNQKQEAITSDTDALVVLLSSHPVAEYQQVITDFRKGSMMTVMLSTQRSDGRQVWQIFNNDPEANGTEIEFYSSSSEGDFTIGTDISQNYLSVDQTFLSSENTTYALKTLLPLEPIREASGVVLLLLPQKLARHARFAPASRQPALPGFARWHQSQSPDPIPC